MALVVGSAALVVMLVTARMGVGLLASSLTAAADAELEHQAYAAAARLTSGADTAMVAGPGLRVVDTAGQPVDGGPALPLLPPQVRELASGSAIVAGGTDGLRRWLAEPAVLPDGTTRLVIVTGDVVGGATLLGRAAAAFAFAALGITLLVGCSAWLGTRAALLPVDRLRAAAAVLPPGERLPVPPACDELHALTEELNRLLARRDEVAAKLERFTGDAAHELRSPVAAIRVQAEVAVAHPDPQLAEETLRAVAAEAVRLSTLLDDLLALARADAGERPPAVAVDLVAAAGAALARATRRSTRPEPVVELVAPTPASVAATPSEVALVLDNLVVNGRRYARSIVRVVVLPAGRWVRLIVEDDGPGIDEADRERVFDRFTRLHPEATDREPAACRVDGAVDGAPDAALDPVGSDPVASGSGLGLALVAALVHGRGGTVTAAATSSGGARLEIRWPAAPPPTPVNPAPHAGESRVSPR